ncbi:hypothetical protein KBA63_03320 [Candidatus Woesebacteria bacterium]|nr:hypothetical protein [Candidatus Woesebacteria bacterium]
MRKKVELSSVLFCTLLSIGTWMLIYFIFLGDTRTWTDIDISKLVIGAALTPILILFLVKDDENVSASSKTEPKTGMQGDWERSHPEWMHISDFRKRHGSDYIELSQKNPEFLNQFCPECGEELYIRNWQVSAYDPRTGAPTTKVIQVTCPWHGDQSRKISEPFPKVLL